MISIIVPTRNESETIKFFIKDLSRIKNLVDEKIELIISDFSEDKTAEIAKKYIRKFRIKGKVVKCAKPGKGLAIIYGSNFAKGDKLFFIDADLQYPLEALPKMLKLMKENRLDAVLTKRLRKDPLFRRILGYAYRLFVSILFFVKYETQSTERLINANTWKILVKKIKSTGWSWDVELIYLLKKYRVKVGVVPVIYKQRLANISKITLGSIVSMLFETIRIRLRYI